MTHLRPLKTVDNGTGYILAADAGGNAGLQAWQDALRGVFAVTLSEAEPAGFRGGRLAVWRAGGMVAAHLAAGGVWLGRRPGETGTVASDDFAVCLVRDGALGVRCWDSGTEVGKGGAVVIDMIQPVDLRFGFAGEEGADAESTCSLVVWLSRPRLLAALRRMHADDTMLHGLVLNGAIAGVVGSALAGLVEGAGSGSERADETLGDAVVDLVARAVAPLLMTCHASAAGQVPNGSLATICRYIHAHLAAGDLNADRLALRFGLSRASLYRLFRPLGGVAGYIQEQRLNEALNELRAAEFSNHRIAQISFRLGFKNVSNFSRAFRDRFGMSPSEARKLAPLTSPAVSPVADTGKGEFLADWLARPKRC